MIKKLFGTFFAFIMWMFYSVLAYLFYYYLFGTILKFIGSTNEYVQMVYEFVFENTYSDVVNILMGLILGGAYTYIWITKD